MLRFFSLLFFFFLICLQIQAQTGPGIGFYATGSETGMGFRSGKESRWLLDARVTKANMYTDKKQPSTFSTEASAVCRLIKLEKVRFHMGIGYKAEWNLHAQNKQGVVVPVGVEAFPFPFQNAGLFFEAGIFMLSDPNQNYYSGIRTAAGLVFYFQKRSKTEPKP